jgi:hypothetical protein
VDKITQMQLFDDGWNTMRERIFANQKHLGVIPHEAQLTPWPETGAAPGKHTLEFDWKYDGPGLGKGGTGTLKVDGKVVDSHPMPRSLPISLAWDEYFNVGLDTATSVDDQDDQVPFRFTGKIDKLTVQLGRNE